MENVYDLWLGEKMFAFKNDVRTLAQAYRSSYDVFTDPDFSEKMKHKLSDACIQAISDRELSRAVLLAEQCAKLNISAIPYGSEFYPAFLRDIETPPYLLFVKGDARVLKEKFCVTTVGTRRMTTYGKYCAFKLSYEIASAGGVIVSGMAKGIDSVTHAGALAAGGKTIAVLGSGVDVVYPPQHRILYSKIIEHGGAVVSEFFPGTTPQPRFFPQRNRIICGISYATVVLEAPKNSGALITAGEAIKEGRTVFALPGNISAENSYGTNELIQGGARLIRSAQDVLAEYNNVSNIKINFNAYKNARVNADLCNRALYELKIVSDKPRADVGADEAGKIFAEYENSTSLKNSKADGNEGDFPLSKFADKFSHRSDVGKKIKEEKTELPSEEAKEKSTPTTDRKADNSVKTKSVGYEELVLECEALGVEIDDEMKKVCKVLSENERITVDVLHHSGCSTKASLQALTILSQTGRVEEIAGGTYIIRRS